jgi:hypothetical protein
MNSINDHYFPPDRVSTPICGAENHEPDLYSLKEVIEGKLSKLDTA